MGGIETFEAIAIFGLFSNDMNDEVNELSILSVMTLGKVVTTQVWLMTKFTVLKNDRKVKQRWDQ